MILDSGISASGVPIQNRFLPRGRAYNEYGAYELS